MFGRRENGDSIMRDHSKKICRARNIHPFVVTHDNSLSIFILRLQHFVYAGLRQSFVGRNHTIIIPSPATLRLCRPTINS